MPRLPRSRSSALSVTEGAVSSDISTAEFQDTSVPKYPSPKILVVDDSEIASALQDRGYAAKTGTFGRPIAVTPASGYLPLELGADLPGYTEQEVVVINLAIPEPQTREINDIQKPGPGVQRIWGRIAPGLIDPRPAAMSYFQNDMDRIYRHGGIFIIFAAEPRTERYLSAELDEFGQLKTYDSRDVVADNWSFLPELSNLVVTRDYGEEMDTTEPAYAHRMDLDNFFNAGAFECIFQPSPSIASRWITLAVSKYGDPISGIIFPQTSDSGPKAGSILIFPQVEYRAELMIELMERVLPVLSPRLFPHAEGTLWTRRDEYDLPNVLALKKKIVEVEEASRLEVRQMEERIEAERMQFGFMHDLLTATGGELVTAVAQALRAIGFTEVQDVDASIEAGGENNELREDLRIMDAPSPVLVEVKGISGKPKEASSLQVVKYLIPRMAEWGKSDLRGLAVINHQRAIPALDRDNDHVFQADVISNVEQQRTGLMTTWDLFRLTRGYLANNWQHEDIEQLFATSGRVMPIPSHYQLIGSLDEYWEKASALGIRLTAGLCIDDRIAYELPVDFIEESVKSIQIDGHNVEEAHSGDYVGIKTILGKQQARSGTRIYRVSSNVLTSQTTN